MSKTDDKKQKIVGAALSLAAEKSWADVTMQEIADEAGVSFSEISALFCDRFDILAVYGRMIDERVMSQKPQDTNSLSSRDLLFDLLMDRFDVLNENRDGILSILNSFKRDPKQALLSLPYLGRSMCWMLEGAGISTAGIQGCLKITGLKMVYLKTLKSWMEDESPDMAKTMAALDKNLGHAESFAMRFGLAENQGQTAPQDAH